MNQFRFENQGTLTYLVYELGSEETLDVTSLGMLTNNRIPGLAQTIFTQLDDKKYIKYNVSAKISVEQIFTRTISKKQLLGIFAGITNALLSAEDYMLDLGSILLDSKYIFSDVATGESVLVCVPVQYADWEQPNITQFFRDIMFHAQFDPKESCDYVARIINFLNANRTPSLTSFQMLLESLRAESAPAPTQAKKPEVEEKMAPVSPIEPELKRVQAGATATETAAEGREEKVSVASVEPVCNSMRVPPAATPEPTSRSGGGTVASAEQEISLFYLLQHYNKENAAAYKAQKERRKAQKREKESGGRFTPKGSAAPEAQKMPAFAIPGRPASPPISSAQAEPEPAAAAHPVQRRPQIPQMGDVGVPSTPQAGGGSADFGDTNYFFNGTDDSATVILGQEQNFQQITPHLLRKRNNEKIPINKEIFRMGRDFDFNDYAIVDNRYVGHSHCHIVSRDGEYFVVDDNSKNHTSVNGTRIPSGQEVKLAHGYVLTVADEEFEFRLY